MKPIPRCQKCQAPLYPAPQLNYDGRRKYCDICRADIKRENDRLRMLRKRKEERKLVKAEKTELEKTQERVSLLEDENRLLREMISELRESLGYRKI